MEYVNLLDVCSPKQWKTLATKELLNDGKYDVYGANGIIGKYNDYNHKETTVLITCRGATCGNIHISNPYSYINGNAMCLDNLDETKCLKEYLYYFLKGINLSNIISGSAQPQITIQGLRKINVRLYDISEQEKIIARLKKIDCLISNKKEQIAKMDELIKSQFTEMFGNIKDSKYNKDYLSNLTFKITDGKHGGCISEENSGLYFIGATEIYDNKINYDGCNQITEEDFNKDYKRCDLKINDFVIVNTGATIGKSAVVTDDRCYKTLLQKSVALIRTNEEKLSPLYLKYCYDLEPSLYNVGQGCARVNLLLSQIKSTLIPVPPIELQNKFEKFAKKINKQKSSLEESLEKLEELQSALMQEYFG